MENGYQLDRSFKHLDYGYAMTSHAAQGKTVDVVLVAQSAQLSSAASDAKQFYVSTTRGREGLKLYTDSIELLKENVSRKRERPMATEILQDQAEAAEKREAKQVRLSVRLGKETKMAAKASVGRPAAKAKVARKAPAREPEIEIVPRRAVERKREQEMGMVMGM